MKVEATQQLKEGEDGQHHWYSIAPHESNFHSLNILSYILISSPSSVHGGGSWHRTALAAKQALLY